MPPMPNTNIGNITALNKMNVKATWIFPNR